MADEDLLSMSAQRAAAMIRRRKLSPVELTEAILAQIERIAPLNAFVTVLGDEARACARAAEEAVLRGEALAPLHGVPVHVKDQLETAGIPTTFGSAIFANNVPARDDILIAKLRAAGTILIGKTRLPEFGHKGLTDGPSFGTTRNPWDPTRTCGGSSGGAAAAVAAGAGPLALGTDGAGSIRIPAACCGVVGLKPTLGAVAWEAGIDAFSNYTYAGPITRSVSDAAVMLRVLLGASPRDPWSLNGPKELILSPGLIGQDLSGLRIGFIRKAANPQLDTDMEANTRASLEALALLGAHVEDVTAPLDWMEFPGRILYQGSFHVAMQQHLPQWRHTMDPVLLAFVERGGKFSMAEFRAAQYARTTLFRSIQALFSRYDALITPTLTRTALAADFDAANDEVLVNGLKCGITRLGWTAYVYPFNLTGHPALTVPSGFAADGLPTSVQIVGRWGADLDVLRLGALLEEARPWSGKRPRLPS
jgi:aspartyl-tRNA(Asn)/glutamyl-tRNA(Gln) amidotransferase subunit A